MSNYAKNSILVVDDDPTNLVLLGRILGTAYTIYVAKDGTTALEMAKKHMPDLILLDIIMQDMNGYEVMHHLKSTPEICKIPVIFISALNSEEDEEQGLGLDAVDYISKPFNVRIVKLRVHNQIKIVNAMRTIEHLSSIDQLTSLYNRRSFNEIISVNWHRSLRDGSIISLLLMDIDHFKRYNDTYGHIQGDVALKTVSGTIKNCMQRSTDMASRWGGEEFAICLPLTDQQGALVLAEKIRASIEATVIMHNAEPHNITVSIGVNTIAPKLEGSIRDSDIEAFLIDTDNALYRAKREGRNRICVFEKNAET